VILLAVGLATLAIPVTAVAANPPAQGQYVLPSPSAGGSAQSNGQGGHQSGVPASATTSGGGSDAALPILLVGLGAIGAAAGVIVYRKRRNTSGESE
jgi:LPXTG-motif cell wall-anchored protein